MKAYMATWNWLFTPRSTLAAGVLKHTLLPTDERFYLLIYLFLHQSATFLSWNRSYLHVFFFAVVGDLDEMRPSRWTSEERVVVDWLETEQSDWWLCVAEPRLISHVVAADRLIFVIKYVLLVGGKHPEKIQLRE